MLLMAVVRNVEPLDRTTFMVLRSVYGATDSRFLLK